MSHSDYHEGQKMADIKTTGTVGWREGSVIERAHCSLRGPEYGFCIHFKWLTTGYITPVPGDLFLASCTHTYNLKTKTKQS